MDDEQERWLRELYDRQYGRMLRFARRALPASARADAEDVVQGVFLEAALTCVSRSWTVLGDGWLIQRLRSRIADHYRRRQRQQRLAEAAAEAGRVETVEEVAGDRAAVEELLALIPDRDDRLALSLKVHGYREAEIASILCVPYEGRQVRDRMQRVRRQVSAWRRARSATPFESPWSTDAGRT